ncbi:Uncharacterized protein ALO91_05882 [Pseudomonas syringae pv. aceris]|uniref:Uncharacterized protein n=1 Tax=Pseudomonas syringae pv. aceris TaxID=199198 RepID=A0A0P9H9Q8_PSESX|nr:Uncharacterized protein ALO91_05882 [Pseudomonas syringae pv. aceris]
MDFVVIEVLKGQAIAGQQTRNGVDRRHQQPFCTVDEIHRCGLAITPVGQHRQAPLASPFLAGQQHHRCAIGQRCRIARRQGALGAALERGLEAGELFKRQVRTQVVVTDQPQIRRHQIILPALGVGRGHFQMALERQLILRPALYAPGLRHQLAMLAHRQARAWLAVTRQLRFEVVWTQLHQSLELVTGRLAAVYLQQDLAQPLVDADRGIGRGVHATGNAALDLPQSDLVGHQQRRFQPRTARLLNVVSRGLCREPRAEHAFAGQVEVSGVLEHRARHHLAHAQPVQIEALDQPFQSSREHVLIAGLGIRAIGARERNAVTADDGDPTRMRHGKLPFFKRMNEPCRSQEQTSCHRGPFL